MMGRDDGERARVSEQKYRPLKNLLKKNYKLIVECADKGRFPSSSLLADFMAQVKTMVSYPGFGDEHYEPFTAACNDLLKACKGKNHDLFREKLEVVTAFKKECHGNYK